MVIAEKRLPVKEETQRRLKVYCAENKLTFDMAINHLLDKINTK